MTRTSLKRRLFALAALWNAVALGLSWIALSLLFERHTERQVTSELIRYGEALVAAISLDEQGAPLVSQGPYDPRFQRPASGLYWHVTAPTRTAHSRSLWDGGWPEWQKPSPKGWESRTTDGPFEPSMIRIARTIRPDASGPELLVEVGLDHQAITKARGDFARELGLFLLVLWSILTMASVVQVTQGLSPLAVVRARLAGLRSDAQARLDAKDHPDEVGPLIEAINDLADVRSADMDRARARARDLAHALKTPLTALKMQITDVPDSKARAGLHESLNVLNIAVQAELARAQTGAHSQGNCLALPVVTRLIGVVGRTPAGANLRFETEIAQDLNLPLGEDAAFEVLGALLDNASRHARSTIRIVARKTGEIVSLQVEDDGPGLAEEARSRALIRGVRLDEASGTQGLGLAITGDLIAASGGTVALETSDLGGLTVKLVWEQSAS